ncbi:hypothetical protein BDV95DRAFT_391490 [Massariosphaeria phaeospora]|uniref:Uncharacterized protein n=1 Tax=Massariosphaeria phaeospora TaxID=100035 RepID=A0A7C8I9G3_9PLEO|nr:hypothetical protein BDV95DRAFT_391490 [Massariosphaeria phaeospora]
MTSRREPAEVDPPPPSPRFSASGATGLNSTSGQASKSRGGQMSTWKDLTYPEGKQANRQYLTANFDRMKFVRPGDYDNDPIPEEPPFPKGTPYLKSNLDNIRFVRPDRTTAKEPPIRDLRGLSSSFSRKQVQEFFELDEADSKRLEEFIKQELTRHDLFGKADLGRNGDAEEKQLDDIVYTIKQEFLLKIPGYRLPYDADYLLLCKMKYVNRQKRYMASDQYLHRRYKKAKDAVPKEADAVSIKKTDQIISLEVQRNELTAEFEHNKSRRRHLLEELAAKNSEDREEKWTEVHALIARRAKIEQERHDAGVKRDKLVQELTNEEFEKLRKLRKGLSMPFGT